MITKLNLATNPFRNRNLPYLLALFLLAISVAGALLSFGRLQSNGEKNKQVMADIKVLEDEVAVLNGRGAQIQQQLTPEQQNVLIAAHKLVSNKSFVWSRLFSDLESVLPGDVSASRIVVRNIYSDGDQVKAELEFAVISKDYSSIRNMIDTMNNSGLFQAELRGQDLQKNERMTYTEYTLRLLYSQTGGHTVNPEVAQNGGGQ